MDTKTELIERIRNAQSPEALEAIFRGAGKAAQAADDDGQNPLLRDPETEAELMKAATKLHMTQGHAIDAAMQLAEQMFYGRANAALARDQESADARKGSAAALANEESLPMQAIDPVRLKAAAEHLEWVLRQYPQSEDVHSLLRALLPLIEDAKAGRVPEPVDSMMDIPGAYNFGDGLYVPYKNPSVGGAYADFVTEMEGGLTEQDKRRQARMEAMWDAKKMGG